MTTPPLPYFFDEALSASTAKQLSAREETLNFSLDDLQWLLNVYLPTQASRQAHASPMTVHRVLLTPTGATGIPLAGAFAMSRPDNGAVILYTPCNGLTGFANLPALNTAVQTWLESSSAAPDLLRLLSIEQRHAIAGDTLPTIATEEIEGGVFEDQQHVLDLNLRSNRLLLLDELKKLPTLQTMLDERLEIALQKPFPNLDQRLTRLSVRHSAAAHPCTSVLSLSDALLRDYLTSTSLLDDCAAFTHPHHGTGSDADNQAWGDAIRQLAQRLTPALHELIEAFWNRPTRYTTSRSALFAEAMRDAFQVQLLLKRQAGDLTAQEYVQLRGVGHTPAAIAPFHIEAVRVTAPDKHFVQLASTLLIRDRDNLRFSYQPAKGIDVSNNLSTARRTLLSRLKSDEHQDTLLDFMSLRERHAFLSMPASERVITGHPLGGPVFEQVVGDIRHKQLDNLRHALSRYRASEGMLEPHALVDDALDVRRWIDPELAAADADGRWSTQLDLRAQTQPSAARAEVSSEQSAILASAEHELEQRVSRHSPLPTTTRTVADARRWVESSVVPLHSAFAYGLSTALRGELELRSVSGTLGSTEQAMIKTVLDTPARRHRSALNGFLPEVFSLALNASAVAAPLQLASCFVLTERGGLDKAHSGKAIAWTPALGFETFPGLTPLLAELSRRLNSEDDRCALLENLARSERVPDRSYSLAPLQRVDDHLLDHVLKPHVQLDETLLGKAFATTLPASAQANLLDLVALRRPATGLDRATGIAHALSMANKLPVWLANASVDDLKLHAELLQRYLGTVTSDQDYLSGLRSLAGTAHHELHARLKADGHAIDPDKVQVHIEARPTQAASTQKLTDFALAHFKEIDQAGFTLASLDGSPIPAAMKVSYIKTLVRQLKLGDQHLATLKQALQDNQTTATQHRQRFCAQLPWQLLHHAHSEKLQERLSATGFDLIRQIVDMPDALARAAVEGAHAIIRPLELLGISTQAINVPGAYLISSAKDRAAPHVLIAPYSPRHGVKEYADEAQLLSELGQRGALLDWVLLNTPQADRALLEKRLGHPHTRAQRATEASTHVPVTALSLASNAIKGNALVHLFKDNLGLLARLLGCQSDENRQSAWSTVKQVLGEDVHEATAFVSGKLAYPVTVWRGFRDIKQSAEDLQTHKWGAALQAFVSGIARFAAVRQSMSGQAPLSSVVSTPTSEATEAPVKVQNINMAAPERLGLNKHQTLDVDLASLTHDVKLGLYTHSQSKQHYAPIEGKVCPVAKHGPHWCIGDSQTRGPRVRQNASKQWVVNRQLSSTRFGLCKRLDTATTVWANMDVDARGMTQIRQLFPHRARQIEEALDLATTYAWNAFRNLQALKTSGDTITPTHQLIMDFIDVPAVATAHVEQLEKVVGDLFAALLDPSLRKPNSKRMVVGRLLEDGHFTFAFTVPTDAKKKIYLAERFFHPGFEFYREHLTDRTFPIGPHSRAATLIHEISHLACNTEDIAYLDAGRPFADLIGTATRRPPRRKKP